MGGSKFEVVVSMKISGCMLCYNEIDLIRISVLNMLRFVDELIICDGDSTDGTLDILHDMEKEYKQIQLKVKRQEAFRHRHADNREHYSACGFNEIERRNYALSQCHYNYILIKDVDELYHHNTNFHEIIKSGHFSYNEVLYEVANRQEYFGDVRIRAHHGVPKLIKNDPQIRYDRFNNSTRAKLGIDCILFKNNRLVSHIDDIIGAFDRWHYKMLICNAFYKERLNQTRLTKLPDSVPMEHLEMCRLAENAHVGGKQ